MPQFEYKTVVIRAPRSGGLFTSKVADNAALKFEAVLNKLEKQG